MTIKVVKVCIDIVCFGTRKYLTSLSASARHKVTLNSSLNIFLSPLNSPFIFLTVSLSLSINLFILLYLYLSIYLTVFSGVYIYHTLYLSHRGSRNRIGTLKGPHANHRRKRWLLDERIAHKFSRKKVYTQRGPRTYNYESLMYCHSQVIYQSHCLFLSPVGWGSKVCRQHLFRGVRALLQKKKQTSWIRH